VSSGNNAQQLPTMPSMRVEYDEQADMAYIYLREIEPGGVASTAPGWPGTEAFGVNLDFDAEGQLIGIEVDAASSRLPAELLATAERL